MSDLENFKDRDPFADTGGDSIGSDPKQNKNIHIRIQQRNGRKTLTTIQGLPKEFDLVRILKRLKKDFSTNGNIVADPELGDIIQLQGDQRLKTKDFIVDELNHDLKNIKIHGF